MHITGTMTQMETYFDEWHTEDFIASHSNLITRINNIEANQSDKNNNFSDAILKLANLISNKLDNDSTQITSIDNINSITSKNEAKPGEINLKRFNSKITENSNNINNLIKIIGVNTGNNNDSIFERIESLENSTPSTENIDNRVQNFFNGNEIPTNSDLNTYKTPGIYRCKDDTIAKNLQNRAIDKAFNLIVLRHKDNSVRQIINEYENNNIWIRNYQNVEQKWTNWTKLYGEHNTFTFPMEVQFSEKGTKTYTIIATDIQE